MEALTNDSLGGRTVAILVEGMDPAKRCLFDWLMSGMDRWAGTTGGVLPVSGDATVLPIDQRVQEMEVDLDEILSINRGLYDDVSELQKKFDNATEEAATWKRSFETLEAEHAILGSKATYFDQAVDAHRKENQRLKDELAKVYADLHKLQQAPAKPSALDDLPPYVAPVPEEYKSSRGISPDSSQPIDAAQKEAQTRTRLLAMIGTIPDTVKVLDAALVCQVVKALHQEEDKPISVADMAKVFKTDPAKTSGLASNLRKHAANLKGLGLDDRNTYLSLLLGALRAAGAKVAK